MHIDPRLPEPTYRQLAGELRRMIGSGEIGPDDPLPSITELVGETGLSVGTVRRAVGLLAIEGLVVVVPGRGTFVRRSE